MTRDCFDLLCQRKIAGVGEQNFKSEPCIDAFLTGRDTMYDTHVKSSSGYIVGEVKLVILLHLLGGGDALDLTVTFGIYS